MQIKQVLLSLSVLGLILVAGCSDSSNNNIAPLTEAQQLQAQFGNCQEKILASAMDELLNFEDRSGPVTLVQFIDVEDKEIFAQYENEIADVWNTVGGDTYFSSEVFGILISDRPFTSIRAITIPNTPILLDAMNSADFTVAMNTLCASVNDLIWVLGRPLDLPFEPGGSYTDPDLQNLTEEDALALLGGSVSESEFTLDPEESVIIDMIVSDDPAPFWMANLIKFYEKAQYPDDPDSALTGREANDIYAQSLIPLLLQYTSLPELVLDIDIIFTAEETQWDQAVLQRYASRDAFLRIFPLNPAAADSIKHKDAAVSDTIVLATE
jgi:hypothetical protein